MKTEKQLKLQLPCTPVLLISNRFQRCGQIKIKRSVRHGASVLNEDETRAAQTLTLARAVSLFRQFPFVCLVQSIFAQHAHAAIQTTIDSSHCASTLRTITHDADCINSCKKYSVLDASSASSSRQ